MSATKPSDVKPAGPGSAAGGTRSGSLAVTTPAQWRAVSSPTRFEMLEMMRSAAPCSVAELARQMDRPADGLYHHLRQLLDAGLVVEAAPREGGRQGEAIYDLAGDELTFDYEPSTAKNLAPARKTAAALIRLMRRSVDAGLGDPTVRTAGPGRTLRCRFDTAWLSDEALAQVNAHFEAVTELVREGNRRREGRLVSLGAVMSPALRTRRADDGED